MNHRKGHGATNCRFAEVGLSTAHRARPCFVEEGLVAAVFWKSAESRQYRGLNEEQETYLIALACSPAPEGRKRWTLRLLADSFVALGIVDAISHECVRKTPKQKNVIFS
jgi:hypothetical protein